MSADDDRLTRLRELIHRLEGLPESPESEWMLREARARMVDVETGERPSGMRPLSVPADSDPARRPPPPRPKVRPADAVDEKPDADAPARAGGDAGAGGERSAPDAGASDAPFGTDGLLSLDDSSSGGPAEDDDSGPRPWRRGLRG